ncbi:MAG: hypothetical protein AAF236_08730 [Verrucomicrobiota bacterium]
MKTLPLPLLFIAIALTFTACSSFERDWRKAVADYEAGGVEAPNGPWSGTWTTTSNGHSGDLRAIVTPDGTSDGDYKFRYHATWLGGFSGTFPVTYPVTRSGSRWKVTGEENLGIFGSFRHDGTITKNRFDATYSDDQGAVGEFKMTRPSSGD